MADRPSVWQRRLQAAESAIRLLDEVGLDQSTQVDVFSLCEFVGLWLAFMPMDNALGAFIPEGAGGVLVTTERPATVQRYTAAHELGHWRLDTDDTVAVDGEAQVLGTPPSERERLAQIFAANLLMPPPLILSTLARVGYRDGEEINEVQAYAVAREAGVSYEAGVRQLTNLNLVSADAASTLLAQSPLAIKASLAHGRRPINGYADVWPVDESWSDQMVPLRLEDEIVISLPENRTTGFRWTSPNDPVTPLPRQPAPNPFSDAPARLDTEEVARVLAALSAAPPRGRAPDAVMARLRSIGSRTRPERTDVPLSDAVELVGDSYVPARAPGIRAKDARRLRIAAAQEQPVDDEKVATTAPLDPVAGAAGRRVLGIRFRVPGRHTLRLAYRSPYSDEEAVEHYVLHAVVEPRRGSFSIEQLAGDDAQWVDEVKRRQFEAAAAGHGAQEDDAFE